MATSRNKGTTLAATLQRDLLVVALAFSFVLFLATSLAARAGENNLSADDTTCLACHSGDGFEKTMADGKTLSLHIAGKTYAQSVHKVVGCAACHTTIDLKSHPPQKGKKISNRRDYSVASVEICRQCHDDKFKLYEGSIHATLVRDGNRTAPLCTDCHNPHSVRAKASEQPIAEVPCRKCHSAIYDAYAASMHGQARSASAHSGAPICADCHRAHDVSAASVGTHVKDACLGCHADALESHQKWLPNAATHFESVSCPVCHAPTAQRRVDLRLYDNAQERMAEKKGVPQFEMKTRAADVKGQGIDAIALQSMLREFGREDGQGKTTLRGRLEVRTGAEAHQLVDKSKAISDCDSCHREGADAFQTVTISIVGADGRPLRHGAQKEVLNSAISVDSVGGFYAIGGTRIKLLDLLLVFAIGCGVAVAVGHPTLKWLARKYLNAIEKDRATAAASGKTPSGPANRDASAE